MRAVESARQSVVTIRAEGGRRETSPVDDLLWLPFNVGRTLVVNGTWEVPSAKSWSGPAKWVTDGWELGLIFTASDGVPFTATWGTGSDPAGTLSSDDFAFPNRLGGPGCGGRG